MSLSPFWVDLHVHTVLSPCGELEMGAPEIAEACREAGISLVAVTDHNASDNVPAVMEASGGNPVVIPGMEVQSAEDIHVVVLFPDMEAAESYQCWLWKRMPRRGNRPEIFGDQLIIDSKNAILGEQETLLIQGAGYSVDEVASEACGRGYLVVLAHVDRPFFSYESVLGPVPEDFPCHALELSAAVNRSSFGSWKKRYPRRLFLRSSDSHRLSQISRDRGTCMLLQAPSFGELRLAFSGQDGRRVFSPWEDVPSPCRSSSSA